MLSGELYHAFNVFLRMYRIVFITLFFTATNASAQNFKKVDFSALEKLMKSNNDTLQVINLWATWCKPCIQELPYFEKIHKDYASKNVKVILVSLDTEKYWESALTPFLLRNPMTAEVWALYNQKPSDWIDRVAPQWSGAIPGTLFLLNGEKYFFEQEFTYESLQEQIHQLTKK